jgi:hypothetical protein
MERSRLPLPVLEQREVATGYISVRVILRNNLKQRKLYIDSDVTKYIPAHLAKDLSQDETRSPQGWRISSATVFVHL